jgi:uncharacterized membrane protein
MTPSRPTESTIAERLEALVLRLSNAVERNPGWVLAGISLIYFAVTGLLAVRRILWYDELSTYHVAILPDFSHVWGVLAGGSDLNPPLYFIITRAFVALFGAAAAVLRLPSMIGFWIMTVCLYLFVARRTSPLFGFVAMCFALVTVAYDYAYEARPYGVMLGFVGLALVFWQMAADGEHRKIAVPFLFLSLAGAVGNHYYAVLVLGAFAVAELVRSVRTKRVDYAVLAALAASLSPLLLSVPQMQSAGEFKAAHWARPRWSSFAETYIWMLEPSLLSVAALLFAATLLSVLVGARPRGRDPHPALAPRTEDFAVALGFLAIPVMGVVLGMLITGVFTPRYVISCVIGFSIIAAFCAFHLSAGSRTAGLLLLLVLMGSFVADNVYAEARRLGRERQRLALIDEFLGAHADLPLPLVLSDPLLHFQLPHYARSATTRNAIYLADPARAIRFIGHDSADRSTLKFDYIPLNVANYDSFVAQHPEFLVHWHDSATAWTPAALVADGLKLELVAQREGEFLFRVSRPSGADVTR